MIRIAQVRAELDYESKPLPLLAARALHVRQEEIASVRIARKSVDARDQGRRAFFADFGCGDEKAARSPS